jgi:hypothetical protein
VAEGGSRSDRCGPRPVARIASTPDRSGTIICRPGKFSSRRPNRSGGGQEQPDPREPNPSQDERKRGQSFPSRRRSELIINGSRAPIKISSQRRPLEYSPRSLLVEVESRYVAYGRADYWGFAFPPSLAPPFSLAGLFCLSKLTRDCQRTTSRRPSGGPKRLGGIFN